MHMPEKPPRTPTSTRTPPVHAAATQPALAAPPVALPPRRADQRGPLTATWNSPRSAIVAADGRRPAPTTPPPADTHPLIVTTAVAAQPLGAAAALYPPRGPRQAQGASASAPSSATGEDGRPPPTKWGYAPAGHRGQRGGTSAQRTTDSRGGPGVKRPTAAKLFPPPAAVTAPCRASADTGGVAPIAHTPPNSRAAPPHHRHRRRLAAARNSCREAPTGGVAVSGGAPPPSAAPPIYRSAHESATAAHRQPAASSLARRDARVTPAAAATKRVGIVGPHAEDSGPRWGRKRGYRRGRGPHGEDSGPRDERGGVSPWRT